jgi:hypothetical protein
MLDILISESVNLDIVLAIIVIGFIAVLYRISRHYNQDMQWVYAEYNKLVDEHDRVKLENNILKAELEILKNENTKLNLQVLIKSDKLDVESTK